MIFKLSLMYDITDYTAYGAYCEKAEPIVKAHGGRYAAVTYNHYNIVSIEGKKPEAVNIAIFPSLEHYMAFYNSKEYQAIIGERQSVCKSQLIVLERAK